MKIVNKLNSNIQTGTRVKWNNVQNFVSTRVTGAKKIELYEQLNLFIHNIDGIRGIH